MALLSLKNVSLSYGGQPLLDGVEFNVERGDRICLLGVNGAGKSSMLRILAREAEPDSGAVVRATGIRVARLPQQVPTHLQGRVFDIVCPNPAVTPEGRSDLEATQIISRLGLDPEADFATLSGGTRRRVLLAHALADSPDVVLLDEPTNHLDLDSIAWLEDFLLRHCRTFLFVTHDRAFLRRMATRIVELDRGRISDWNCDYDTFLQRKEAVLHAESMQWAEQDRLLKKEEAWLRQGVKARRTRNEGRVRALLALREDRRRRRERSGSVQMAIQEAGRTGQVVLKAKGVSFSFGDRPIIRDFSAVVDRGDRVGILGPNGCGKTTLLRLLLEAGDAKGGGLVPQTGAVERGTNLIIAYSDQLRAGLDDERSLVENIAPDKEFVTINGVRRHVIGYLQDFLFPPECARRPVCSLSGGERNRLLLARLFAQPSNVLVLDEPTNDLDLDTLELLEDQLASYSGTVLLVSHDRDFLNNVVTGVLAFEKGRTDEPGRWLGPDDGWFVNEYVGGYDEWAAQRRVPPAPVATPKPAPPPAPARPAKRKLSSKERRELDALPGRIEALEAEQALWHARLADPAFYRRGGDDIAQARTRGEELVAELEAAYHRWAELEAVVAAQGNSAAG